MEWYWWIVIVCGGVYFICGIGLGVEYEQESLAKYRDRRKLNLLLAICLKVFLMGCFWLFLWLIIGAWWGFQAEMDYVISR